MKKIIIPIIASLITFVATAQIQKGTLMAGANSNLGLGTELGTSTNWTNFYINPRGGYFFMDNWVGGLNLGFSRNGDKMGHYSSYTTGLFTRYYVKGKFFFGGEFGAIFSESKLELPFGSGKSTEPYGSLYAGYAAFLNPNIAIEPMLSYNIGPYSSNSLTLGVGFTLFFNKRKKP